MGAGHGHGHALGLQDGSGGRDRRGRAAARRQGRRAVLVMLALLVPVALATAVGMVALWPDADSARDRPSFTAPGVTVPRGEVSRVTEVRCDGGEPPAQGVEPTTPDTSGGASEGNSEQCVRLAVRLEPDTAPEGAPAEVTVVAPPRATSAGLAAGDQVTLLALPGEAGEPMTYAFNDLVRTPPLLTLAALFAVVVIAVARVRGLLALVGLAIAYAVIVAFMLPALLQGENALLVGLVGSTAIMFVLLYLAHGVSARTTTALIGTLFGLGMSALLGWWGTRAAHLSGLADEDNQLLATVATDVDLRGVILCGITLAGLGVLNDVTITQSSAVWELHEASPSLTPSQLFGRAMRIGRDHIASTVYTIAFAYAGAALPVLLLIELYDRPLLEMLGTEPIAEEVVRTLVGSVGLVLAIPLTTAVAVAVVTASRRGRAAPDQERRSTSALA